MSSHTAWGQMIARCYDPKNPKYPSYGGRGIKVCDRWICRRLFVEDMGERPDGKTLNRINNDGDYSPENCEWATYSDQAQNRRDNRNITFNGETKCATEWERITGIKRKTLCKRLDYGWTVEKALTYPVSKSNRSLDNTHEDNYIR
jgi:hypothetical protein